MNTTQKSALSLLAAVVAAATPAFADTFTIAVIPDTQNYTDYANRTNGAAQQQFLNETNYLANNKAALNLAFVTHVGDVVQHGDLQGSRDITDGEWVRAQSAMNVLSTAGIPFALTPGNHDYDNYSHTSGSRPLAGAVKWNQYFGPSSSFFSGQSWYGGSFNNGMDSFQTFTAGGKTIMNLSLEMCPTNDAITWAQGVINAHPGVPTMITTHDFLNYTLTPASANNSQARNNDLTSYFNGTNVNNTPDQLWSKLITGNDQIFMVVSGHTWGGTDSTGVSTPENLRIDNNDFGHPVYQVLSDYQGNTFTYNPSTGVYTPNQYIGGEGWLRLMTFDTDANTIHFQTYSPTLNQYAGVAGGPTFKIDASFSDFTLAIPTQAVPEPASLVLVSLGGLTLIARRRRT